MPLKRRRSPQEKKALSYAKDRRNCYGESDKGARKTIPRNKAKGHRSLRRRAASSLSRYETLNEDEAALTENALVSDLDRLGRWKKAPDQTLADHLKQQGKRRHYRDGRRVWERKNQPKQREDGSTDFPCWGGSDDSSFFINVPVVLKRS
ncbi:MAG: hypothetical protein AAF251_13780 [Pseudomonadota bacterium]